MTPSKRLLPGSGLLFTNRAIRILLLAGKLARQTTSLVSPSHILQALAWGERGNGRAILERSSIDLPAIVGMPPDFLGGMLDKIPMIALELDGLSNQLIELGGRETLDVGLGKAIGTESLVFGILAMTDLPECKILTQYGVSLVSAKEALDRARREVRKEG
ncbi:MAG: Clp protease N-terminal domain-containing protein [Planctomycetota bacterium]